MKTKTDRPRKPVRSREAYRFDVFWQQRSRWKTRGHGFYTPFSLFSAPC